MTIAFMVFCFVPVSGYSASEVMPETAAKVIVRDHPRTGRPYAVITSDASVNPFEKLPVLTKARPDYRMLDPKIKSGKIPYQGPVSDRKKVYVFAGSIATLGAAGGLAMMAAVPAAATGVGASGGGAGAYALAATALASGAASTAWIKTRPNPSKDKIEHAFESREIE